MWPEPTRLARDLLNKQATGGAASLSHDSSASRRSADKPAAKAVFAKL